MTATWIAGPCPSPCQRTAEAARARQDQLTKPNGALGRLERLAVDLAALQQRERPSAVLAPIIVFAGDHGVTARGVSAYPSAVTVEMLRNFARGGAAISVLARELGSSLTVVDAGTLAAAPVPGVVTDKPERGTADFTLAPAMSGKACGFALAAGRRAVERVLAGQGADILLLGEMGIGNTTSAAAIICALTGAVPEAIVGDGTGIDAAGRARKAEVIAEALALHRLAGADALSVLEVVGGFEIAALVGAIVTAAQSRLPVLVDGFIVSAAALVAVRLNTGVAPWLVYSHRSAERGHAAVLEALGAEPILDLSLRLGEGSGAALALPIVRLACALHGGMATFAEAAVSGPSDVGAAGPGRAAT